MSELNKELAKLHLERQGFLVAMDVTFEAGGADAAGFDLVGVRIENRNVSETVVGVVRGWWHAGSYLAPGLIRSHLETDRKFLSEAFSEERIDYLRKHFGLGSATVRKALFFSQRSPGKSDEAEKILASIGIEVIYLEDIVVELLPLVGREPMGDGPMAQVLSMVRHSRLFRELQQAVRDAKKLKECEQNEKAITKEKAPRPKRTDPQLDFLTALSTTIEEEHGDEER